MGTELYSVCDCCGKRDNIMNGVAHHTFGGYAGYGSEHDGEYISLIFCSECLDKMLKARPQDDAAQDSQR